MPDNIDDNNEEVEDEGQLTTDRAGVPLTSNLALQLLRRFDAERARATEDNAPERNNNEQTPTSNLYERLFERFDEFDRHNRYERYNWNEDIYRNLPTYGESIAYNPRIGPTSFRGQWIGDDFDALHRHDTRSHTDRQIGPLLHDKVTDWQAHNWDNPSLWFAYKVDRMEIGSKLLHVTSGLVGEVVSVGSLHRYDIEIEIRGIDSRGRHWAAIDRPEAFAIPLEG